MVYRLPKPHMNSYKPRAYNRHCAVSVRFSISGCTGFATGFEVSGLPCYGGTR